MEILLSQYCGSDDIITPIYFEDELIRRKLGFTPQNYLEKKSFLSIFRHESQQKEKFWNHITAKEVKKKISKKIWNNYFKFCFERNPWDKTVSDFFWQKHIRNLGDISFEDYLKTPLSLEYHQYNFPIYTIDDEIVVDYVGRYENLHNNLKQIFKKLGLIFDDSLVHAKGRFRPKNLHYSTYYNFDTQKLVQNYFKKEIDLFDYKFEKKE